MSDDLINGLFELLASVAVLNHCRAVLKARAVAGVSLASTAFFAAWSGWNLHYYPRLDQWFSFGGGIAVGLANLTWIALMVRFRSLPIRKDI